MEQEEEEDVDRVRESTRLTRLDPQTIAIVGLSMLALVLATILISSNFRGNAEQNDGTSGGNFSDYDAVEPSDGSSEEVEEKLGLGLAFFIIMLCFCVICSYLMSRHHFTTLPDCIIYVFAGILVGSTLRIMGASDTAGYALPNQEQFFLFIIPPIILHAGYSLNKEHFFGQAGAIMLFAFVGTAITAIVFGVLLYVVGVFGISYYFRFWEALTFGALISAVDPVATIAIFNAMKVDKTLHYLVFGESVLNDAVAIVLYRTFAHMIGPVKPLWYVPIVQLVYIFFGSAIVGALTSCITAFILKNTEIYQSPSLELSFYVLMAFLPYFLCEGLRMSGIVGILIGAAVLAHYGHPNLSSVGQLSSSQLFKSIAYVSETFVFIYLGIALTSFNHKWDTMTVLTAIIFTLFSRLANIFPLAAVINMYRNEDRISGKTQFIMWFSGLRGAIAFALSLNFPGGNELTRRVVISTTLAIVLFTIIVLGGGTLPLLQFLRVEGVDSSAAVRATRVDPDEFEEVDLSEAVAECRAPYEDVCRCRDLWSHGGEEVDLFLNTFCLWVLLDLFPIYGQSAAVVCAI